MSKEKMLRARELMDSGKYKQARAILRRINDPQAKKMLSRLDDLDPQEERVSGGSSRVKDFFQVILLGLALTAVFSGIGYGIASGMGIPTPAPGAAAAATRAPDTGSTVQNVALQPTLTPTPTEIPCETAAWWSSGGAQLSGVVEDALALDISLPPAQIQAAKAEFETWKSVVESETLAPCLSEVSSAMKATAPDVDALYGHYVTTSTAAERAQGYVRVMDRLLAVTDALNTAGVDTGGAAWIETVESFTRAECPARRWYLEIVVGRDYGRFFRAFRGLDFNQIGAAQASLRDMQSLRSAFASDSEKFPECVKTASDHLLAAMDGFLGYGNARLNGDMGRADQQLQSGNTELANFYSELARLDASLSGVRFNG